MSSTTTAPAAETILQKIFGWITKEVKVVETDVENIIGPNLTAQLEAIGKSIITGEWGPLVTAAIADATDVVNGQMSVSKAISGLVALAEANGKALTQSAALQLIGIAQNALPAVPQTVTPVA